MPPIFAAVGGLTLACGLVIGFGRLRLVRSGVMTQGTVTEMEEHPSGPHSPIVSFTPSGDAVTADGRVVRFRTGNFRGGEDYQVGQAVPVLYDPNNPEQASIATKKQIWGAPVLLILGGLGFWFAAGLIWLVTAFAGSLP